MTKSLYLLGFYGYDPDDGEDCQGDDHELCGILD